MKSFNTIYYLLFVLLIMGAFASMAQNSYGLVILGSVAIAFGLLFFYQFLQTMIQPIPANRVTQLELFSLGLLSILFALRLFHIYIPYSEVFFSIAGLVLAFVYGRKMIGRYNLMKVKNVRFASIMLLYHLSILIFILALVAAPYFPELNGIIGMVAFVLLMVFLLWGLLSPSFLIEGSKHTVFGQVLAYKDRSVIILSLFAIISLYIGLTRIGFLPAMYSDDFPQAYFKLVSKAESGKEEPVNGKYKHQEFKDRYEAFLSKYVK
jgi:hypothetical protein